MSVLKQRWPARLIVGTILAAGLGLRLSVDELMLRRVTEPLPDSMLYVAYAESLCAGNGFVVGTDRALRPPGYPLFLASCWWLVGGESERAVLWAQALLSTLTAWLVYRLGLGLEATGLPTGVAVAAMALTLLEPYSVALQGLVLSETLFTFLLVAAVVAFCPGGTVSPARAVLAGALGGAAVMVRPSGFVLVPLAAAAWMLFAPSKARAAKGVAFAVLGLVFVCLPWWVRNVRVYGTFVPTTLNVGESLYDGLNPLATGASQMQFASRPEIRARPEAVRDRWWRDQALAYVQQHPARVAELALIKLGRFWSPWPNEADFRQPLVVLATTAGTVPVWILAMIGTVKLRRRPGIIVLAILPVVTFCLLHAVFVSSVRYRVPGMPFMSILAGVGWTVVAGMVRRGWEQTRTPPRVADANQGRERM